MLVILVIIAGLVVFAIAAVVIGREARRLDAVPPRPLFQMEEAVDWVADHLPFEVSAILSHEDVHQIIEWNLEFFRTKASSGNGTSRHTNDPVVVGGPETVDYVLARATAEGTGYTAEQVHAVLTAQMAYLDSIGAVGPEAPPEP